MRGEKTRDGVPTTRGGKIVRAQAPQTYPIKAPLKFTGKTGWKIALKGVGGLKDTLSMEKKEEYSVRLGSPARGNG